MMETRTGFQTSDEMHPSEMVDPGHLSHGPGIQELRKAIPDYCFKPSLLWSSGYLLRDLMYSATLSAALYFALGSPSIRDSQILYYIVVNLYAFCQGIVWTGLWIIAHDCGHGGFSSSSALNDFVGFILHSALLAPYFSWKSTHRRHHIYANHIEKDLNYVPPQRDTYASKLGVSIDMIEDIGQDAPVVIFLRILLQQTIGWNWYILSNITCPSTAVVRQKLSAWRYSHFDPWGGLFRDSEVSAVLLSDLGCLATIAALYALYLKVGSFETVFWAYLLPWTWVNHWIVMITYLHHSHPSLPKYSPESWTFVRGATATIDRDFSFIGTHFFHHISSDHVVHHLFSKIPHYYSPVASEAIKPLLGNQYHGKGTFGYTDLVTAFTQCQWVETDDARDVQSGLRLKGKKRDEKDAALWYRGGRSPSVEYKMRDAL